MSLPFMQPYMGLGNSLQTAQGGSGGIGGWVELGRTTLGSAGDTITVSSLADKRYYMILGDFQKSGNARPKLRLNNDSGSNYARRNSTNGAADGTNTSATEIDLEISEAVPEFHNNYLSNLSSKEKLGIQNAVGQNVAGATSAPDREENVYKHAQTSNPISRVDYLNLGGTGDFNTGSEVVVLGWDPADTHTTNFWEELASVSGTGSSTNISSGTITAKKYLWIQFYDGDGKGGGITFNNDTGSNYARRGSLNGAADFTTINNTSVTPGVGGIGGYLNMFIINNSANEKLCICHSVDANTAGAGTAPQRKEEVNKWTNTSSQITEIDFDAAGNYNTDAILKVWGSD